MMIISSRARLRGGQPEVVVGEREQDRIKDKPWKRARDNAFMQSGV